MVKLDNGRTHPKKGAFKPHSNAFKKGTLDWGFYRLLSRRKIFCSTAIYESQAYHMRCFEENAADEVGIENISDN